MRVHEATQGNAGAVMAWATGSAEHVAALQARAKAADLRLEHDGLWSGSRAVSCPDEKSLYEALGCRWVPPELREDGSDLELAASGAVPDLLQERELRGVLHNHTLDSDGGASLEEMAAAAGGRGWSVPRHRRPLAGGPLRQRADGRTAAGSVAEHRRRQPWL